jgi:hypothetical protein
MSGRVVVAGLLAGLVVFVWGMVSHMALPLGKAGFSTLPAEDEVLAALGRHVPEGGLYLFPMEEDPVKWEDAYRTKPHGLMVVSPAGEPLAFGRRLAVELLTNLAGGLFLAFLFAGGMPAVVNWKTGLVAGAALGGFAVVAVDLSYANWYGFPTTYALAQLVDHAVGWGLAGALVGWRLKPRSS